ncbi:MAG: NAD(P)/FAD-dependent oxidoreductase [Bacteroidota bacterium]
MEVTNFKYVILGGGTAAGYAAEELIKQGIGKGELCIISAEETLPINRPPLSKGYMTGDSQIEDLLINDYEFYEDNGIEILLNTKAKEVDFTGKIIILDNNTGVGYEKLLITTGSRIRKLNKPGSDLKNIFYLRTKKDADEIMDAAKKYKKVVVVGGQFISSEVSASLSQLGLDVTTVFPGEFLMNIFSLRETGIFFNQFYEKNGVHIQNNHHVKEFKGIGKIESVILESGEAIDTDMVVLGIGVEPLTDIFEGTALNIDDGIVVNEFGETNIDGVYAAGDVASYPDPIYHVQRRVDHWQNAHDQGKNVAKNMVGRHQEYNVIPYFFSDIFDLSYEYFGDHANANKYYVIGDISKADFSIFWSYNNKMVAALITSERPEIERKKAIEWIKQDVTINEDVLKTSPIPFEEPVS